MGCVLVENLVTYLAQKLVLCLAPLKVGKKEILLGELLG